MLTAALCLLSAIAGALIGAGALAACNAAANADRTFEAARPAGDVIQLAFKDEPDVKP